MREIGFHCGAPNIHAALAPIHDSRQSVEGPLREARPFVEFFSWVLHEWMSKQSLATKCGTGWTQSAGAAVWRGKAPKGSEGHPRVLVILSV